MFRWFKRWRNRNVCMFCKKKTAEPRKYWNDRGEPVVVCPMCVEYAERRALVKR